MKRVFLIVLDSCGIGNAPDSKAFDDEGANTFLTISKSDKFKPRYSNIFVAITSLQPSLPLYKPLEQR